jgi:hypothetical protein
VALVPATDGSALDASLDGCVDIRRDRAPQGDAHRGPYP